MIINEELSTSDPGFCLAYLAHSVLYVNNVFINANEEQRKRFLPQMCDGSSIGGVCITEPDGGTDVLGMRTTAVRKGKEYVLNGRKMWITNGAVNGGLRRFLSSLVELGDAFLVYAKVDGKITSFIVEKGMPGFSLGQQIKHKLGMRASGTAELVFEDVVVPESNRLGEEGQASLCMVFFRSNDEFLDAQLGNRARDPGGTIGRRRRFSVMTMRELRSAVCRS